VNKPTGISPKIDLAAHLGSALVLVLITLLAVRVMLQKFIDPAPFPSSYWDIRWALIFAAMTIAVGLSFWIAKGKILLAVIPLSGLFLLILSSITTGVGPAYLMLLWLTLIALGIGSRLMQWLVPRAELLLFERMVLAILLGLAAVMFLVMIQGWLHAFQPLITWAGLVILTILFVLPRLKDWVKRLVQIATDVRTAWLHANLSGWSLSLGVAAILLLGSWLIAWRRLCAMMRWFTT
jgi:hypothetical protein